MKSKKNNSRSLLKVCGITRAQDLDLCIRCGVDYVGFNFSDTSRRFISPQAVRQLIDDSEFRADVTQLVGVFVNADKKEIKNCLELCPQIRVIQLHGEEEPKEVAAIKAEFGLEVWNAVKVSQPSDITNNISVDSAADLVLLDGQRPGSGQSFNWQLLADSELGRVSWGIAGGIGVDNIYDAVRFGPTLIDIASGVESSPGVKDSDKIQEIMKAIRG